MNTKTIRVGDIENNGLKEMLQRELYTISIRMCEEGMSFAGIPRSDKYFVNLCDKYSHVYETLEDVINATESFYSQMKTYVNDKYRLIDGFAYEDESNDAFSHDALRVDDGAMLCIVPEFNDDDVYISESICVPVLIVKIDVYSRSMINAIYLNGEYYEVIG